MLRSGAFLISTANRMNVSRETFCLFYEKRRCCRVGTCSNVLYVSDLPIRIPVEVSGISCGCFWSVRRSGNGLRQCRREMLAR